MKKIIISLIILISLSAQGSAFSKKNDLGIRKFSNNTYTSAKGYGGSASFSNGASNYLNSATWTYNKYTLLEFFMASANSQITTSNSESTLSDFSINTIGWISQIMDTTLTIGIVINPFLENKGQFFEVQESSLDTNIGNFSNYINYEGGINEAKFAIAYEFSPKLRLSIDALYYFGSLNQQQKFSTDGSESWIETVDELKTTYYGLTTGLNAHYMINYSNYISASIHLPKKLDSKTVLVRTVQDTFDEFRLEDNKDIEIPLKFSFGYFGELTDNWMLSSDYLYEAWNGKYVALNKINVGIEKQASQKVFDSFWERSIFFLGTYYYNEAFKFNNDGNKAENVNNLGFTIGYSAPFNQNQNRFTLSFNYGKRGSLDKNGLSENIFRVNVGLSLQELWYQPEIED